MKPYFSMPLRLHATLIGVCLLAVISACGGTPTGPDTREQTSDATQGPGQPGAPPSPSPAPGPGQAAIDGSVLDEETRQPLAGVKVDAVSGSTSVSLTTDAAGAFRLQLPAGVARFWLSKEGYVSYDKEHTIPPGTTALELTLKKHIVIPPPVRQYTLNGTVIELQGNPVPGAGVLGYRNDSPVDDAVGRTSTDASGRFTLTTTRAPQDVQITKTGYQQTKARVGAFTPDSTASITVVLPRFVRYILVGPSSVNVGQTVRISARVELDNGSTLATVARVLSSSNPSVLSVIDGGWVKGVAPGVATLTEMYEGLTGTLSLRVDP